MEQFNGCEGVVLLEKINDNTALAKKSDFIVKQYLKNPIEIEVSYADVPIVFDSFYIYGRIGVIEKDVFVDFAHNEIRDYNNFTSEESAKAINFGEYKWDMDEDSLYMPYPDFSDWNHKEITDFMNANFNNNFIAKNKNVRMEDMKTIKIEQDFKIPGTDIILEAGDTIQVQEAEVKSIKEDVFSSLMAKAGKHSEGPDGFRAAFWDTIEWMAENYPNSLDEMYKEFNI